MTTITTNNSFCKYICASIIFLAGFVFLIQSVAIVIDYQETQNYINNTCSGIGNFSIKHWNFINNRAVTTAYSLDSDQNITLYYPPVDVWIFWTKDEAHKWYDRLNTLVNANQTFPCYIAYPQKTGITAHLNKLWMYYIIGAVTFIICGGCIIYCCMERTYASRNDYYRLN
jgi:hypothetical protein